MNLPKRTKPLPNYQNLEHYLVFGPLDFDCPYTYQAVDLIHKNKDRAWMRKVDDIQMLYFPNKANPTRTQFETYPQVYFWNRDLKRYHHIGGFEHVERMYNNDSVTSKNYSVKGCGSCKA